MPARSSNLCHTRISALLNLGRSVLGRRAHDGAGALGGTVRAQLSDRIVQGVWNEGWSHHLSRLMVLSNLATLLDVLRASRRIGLGRLYRCLRLGGGAERMDLVTDSVGPLFKTKPYVSGANYIHRMSDYS